MARAPDARPPQRFPIVGIGASAGGLEALEQFLKRVPPRSGLAFVVVQHLDAAHKGALVELLRRTTALPVQEVEDLTTVEPDHVYVIPPGKDMSILHGVLHLLPQTSPRGLNLPIDFFFRSLAEDQQEHGALEKVFVLLRSRTGNDFSLYKRSTIHRRIERHMGLHQIDTLTGYVRYLRENPHELELLFRELLIGVTSFFRDPQEWEHLETSVLPDLLRARAEGGRVLRAWVPGCSTGEEAYSLAIMLYEVINTLGITNLTPQIFATDLDRDAIERARLGVYPANIAADVSPDRLRRFFRQDERGFRVRREIRESVVFAVQNIIMDPPFTKLDLLACRNLLIYLSPELQKKLIPLFHYALSPGGVLFLGTAETVGSFSTLFSPLDAKSRLYRRVDSAVGPPAVEFPPTFAAARGGHRSPVEPAERLKGPPTSLPLLAERVILQNLAPSAVLTTEKGDILYISGRTGKYLEPAAGKAALNVFDMAREGLRHELASAFASTLRHAKAVSAKAIKVVGNGAPYFVDLTVQKLLEPKELRGAVMVVFGEAAPAPARAETKRAKGAHTDRLRELERELRHAREENQTTREEMQTSQEELKSTNEELQSTNEELQSTNEELTTSKEEMQSMNEELQTVNHELQAKVDELSRSNNDMKNLLNSTDIATLFLDGDLLVRRFTVQIAKLIKLIPADAGRPITDIATELEYPELAVDAREVLRTLVFKEKTVPSRGGQWFAVRILPYRTLENVIDGVVITFTDVTATKQLEQALREQANQLEQMAESLPTLVWSCRPDGSCEYVSRQWVSYTGVPGPEQLGWGWLDQVDPDERERVREEWKTAVRTAATLDTEFRIRSAEGALRWFKTRAVPIRDEEGAVVKWYGTCTDIDDVKQAAAERRFAVQNLAMLLEGVSDPFVALDEGGAIAHLNAAAAEMLDGAQTPLVGQDFFEACRQVPRADFEARFAEARRLHRSVTFETTFGAGARARAYAVRVIPGGDALTLFFHAAGAATGGGAT